MRKKFVSYASMMCLESEPLVMSLFADRERPRCGPCVSSEFELCRVSPPPALPLLPAVARPRSPCAAGLQLPSLRPLLHRSPPSGPTHDCTCRGGGSKRAGAGGLTVRRSGGVPLLLVSADFLLLLCLSAPPRPAHLRLPGGGESCWRPRLAGQTESRAVSGGSSIFVLLHLPTTGQQHG